MLRLARRKNEINRDMPVRRERVEAEDFDVSISVFLRNCRIKNLSEYTMRYYKNELIGTLRLLEMRRVDTHPTKITPATIKEDVILAMMEAGLKATTINTRLRALRAFFNFLEAEGMIDESPFQNISLVKAKKEVIQTFTREQIRALFEQPNQATFTGIRDYTIMSLMLDTGIRARELVDLSVGDIRWEDNTILVDGKGNKERLVPMQTTLKRQLRKYVAIRGTLPAESLFVNIDDQTLSKRRIQEFIALYGRRANIQNVRCSPHTFRHTFAKMSVQNGADVFALQKILGHTSLEMVRNYVNLFSADVAAKHKKFSPLENL
ncbi:tyrosine-type recombinase/integrase [Alkalihalobacillus pseudalcaliphilus]|uniref:tyrosine-type recombinase/integrase n=1 Tax=Alkalihalobacillus pseudalcaliphilus TaxID=79884 RepID=UPI0030811CA6